MLTIRFLAIIIGGVIFILIGFFLIKSNRSKRKEKRIGILSSIVGLGLIYIQTIGPLSNSKEVVLSITTIDSTLVDKIIIIPSSKGTQTIKSEIIINDRLEINKLCNELQNSSIKGDAFLKNAEWKCVGILELKTKKEIKFRINRLNGVTRLDINSNGDSGWLYGILRADSFGNEIAKIINQDGALPR